MISKARQLIGELIISLIFLCIFVQSDKYLKRIEYDIWIYKG